MVALNLHWFRGLPTRKLRIHIWCCLDVVWFLIKLWSSTQENNRALLSGGGIAGNEQVRPADPKIQIKYINTKNQLADILTKGKLTRDEWNHLLCLFNVGQNNADWTVSRLPFCKRP